MAESRKPAARKTTARRGPTKAAALKALGLTQADLDTLKAVAAARDAKTNDEAVDKAEELVGHPLRRSEPNVVEASATLRPGFGGDGMGPAPSDPQAHLEDRPAPSSTGQMPAEATKEPVWYIRNLRNVEVSFRLSRQSESTKKRTNLKPRGARGDIVKLEPGDLQDAELQTQVAYELVEVIPEGQAIEAIKKQYTNHSQTIPVHIAALRNELGQEYNTAPRTVSDEESMGYKVADLDPRLMQGRLSDKDIKRDGGFQQDGIMQPVQSPRPGSIVSDGFMAPAQQAVGGAADNERAAAVDALARSKQFEGPGAGLGEVVVKVEPVQRS